MRWELWGWLYYTCQSQPAPPVHQTKHSSLPTDSPSHSTSFSSSSSTSPHTLLHPSIHHLFCILNSTSSINSLLNTHTHTLLTDSAGFIQVNLALKYFKDKFAVVIQSHIELNCMHRASVFEHVCKNARFCSWAYYVHIHACYWPLGALCWMFSKQRPAVNYYYYFIHR